MIIQLVLALASAKYQLDFKKNINTSRILFRQCLIIFIFHRIDTTDQLLKSLFTHSLNSKVATWI